MPAPTMQTSALVSPASGGRAIGGVSRCQREVVAPESVSFMGLSSRAGSSIDANAVPSGGRREGNHPMLATLRSAQRRRAQRKPLERIRKLRYQKTQPPAGCERASFAARPEETPSDARTAPDRVVVARHR